MISFNYGARCYSRTKEAIRLFTRYSFIYAGSVWALLMLLPQPYRRVQWDAALLDAGVPALRIYYCLFFCMAFQIAGQHTFVAVGRSRQAIFFSLLRKVILVIPLVYLLPKLLPWGAIAVFLSEPISISSAAPPATWPCGPRSGRSSAAWKPWNPPTALLPILYEHIPRL